MRKLLFVMLAALLGLSHSIADSLAAERIFFASNRAGVPTTSNFHIWMMNPDGTGLEQVTFGDVVHFGPRLSPDGTKLVFYREPSLGDDCRSIWVHDLLTGEETPVTATTDSPFTFYGSMNPTWSPDGTKIAFQRYTVNPGCRGGVPGSARLWVVDYLPAIGVPSQVSPAAGGSRQSPSWSHDGTNLLYMHEVGGLNPFTIYKITVATEIEEQVILHVGGEYEPRYSPDGTRFAWQSYRHGGGGDIFIADVSNPAGSQTRVTPYSGFVSPTWSPDGSKLAFNSSPGDLWAINADGTGLTQLTSGPATDVGPWWGNVNLNRPPVAQASAASLVECTSPAGASVALDASGSSDPDGDALTYTWTEGATTLATTTDPMKTATVTLGLGTHTIDLTVDDGNGGAATDTVVVTVHDTTAPSIGALTVIPGVLWPPNHRMVPVTLTASATDACDPAPACQIVSVTSNEAVHGLGDGDTAPDWQISGALAVNLRAERSGNGTGRVYTLALQCSDASGNSSTATATVTVPHSQAKK